MSESAIDEVELGQDTADDIRMFIFSDDLGMTDLPENLQHTAFVGLDNIGGVYLSGDYHPDGEKVCKTEFDAQIPDASIEYANHLYFPFEFLMSCNQDHSDVRDLITRLVQAAFDINNSEYSGQDKH